MEWGGKEGRRGARQRAKLHYPIGDALLRQGTKTRACSHARGGGQVSLAQSAEHTGAGVGREATAAEATGWRAVGWWRLRCVHGICTSLGRLTCIAALLLVILHPLTLLSLALAGLLLLLAAFLDRTKHKRLELRVLNLLLRLDPHQLRTRQLQRSGRHEQYRVREPRNTFTRLLEENGVGVEQLMFHTFHHSKTPDFLIAHRSEGERKGREIRVHEI
mmetsp:Transcript_26474/g.45587  ORF Transcript_26474/g.45587 Transcript_26474/m.45587 type:complete len:218 (-) Transcript_26474:859-1512(-)